MKEELKSAFFSKRFLLAFGLMLSCFLGYSLPTWIFSADWGDEFREGALLNTVEPSDGVSISWLNVLKQTRTLSKIGNKPPQYLQ